MSKSRPVLILVDGHSLAYRAFHALPGELATRSGELTNAIFGFASMLLDVIDQHGPQHIAVTFDLGRTFRHDLFEAYKATREAMPDGLDLQMPRIRELVETLGIPVYEAEGWEADDVLGTLARQAEDEGFRVLIVTGDTDAFQLVDEHTRVVTSGRRFSDYVIYDPARVEKRYGISPERLPQWKALRGDSSDNIPGVPGVGDKTATKLLQEYGDVESVLAHVDDLPGKVLPRNVAEHADMVRLGLELATIRRDAPVTFDAEATAFRDYNRPQIVELFRQLEFRTLVDRLPEPAGGTSDQPLEGDYRLVTTDAGLEDVAEQLAKAEAFAFDTETTSLDAMQARLVGLALSDARGRAWYIPMTHGEPVPAKNGGPVQGRLDLRMSNVTAHPMSPKDANLAVGTVLAALRPAFEGPAIKVAHNAKYDMIVMRRHGVDVADPIYDTMVAAWVTEPGSRALGLKDLAWSRLGLSMTSFKELPGGRAEDGAMADVSVEDATLYAGSDVDATLRLREKLEPELDDTLGRDLFERIELPLIRVLADMEMHGVLLDLERLAEISIELGGRIRELEAEIFDIVGHEFNIGSPQQLGTVLFDEMGVPKRRKTQTGYSTAADALADYAGDYPVVDLVLEWRHLNKLKGTYVDALPTIVNPETGRIHSSFQQTAVVTGRLSSSDPNLQNIPVRTEIGESIRRAFVAPPGHMLLAADYSQMELRVLCELSGDPTLEEIFSSGGDIHAATGAFLFDKSPDEVTSNERRIAKMVNFGVLYGMSAYGLAERTGLSREESAEFIDRYFKRYSAVRGYFDGLLEQARESGYVETILGRRRYFPELSPSARVDRNARMRAQREAVNAPIQGSAADIMKAAMIDLHHALQASKLKSAMIIQVHDELLLEVPMEELEDVAGLTREKMTSAVEMDTELVVDLSAGPTWLDLEKLKGPVAQGSDTAPAPT